MTRWFGYFINIIAAAVIVLALSAAGCSNESPATKVQNAAKERTSSVGEPLTASDRAYSSDKVKLVWVAYNLLPGGKKDMILKRWHEKYPNIEVSYKDFPAEPASYTQALNTAFSSNEKVDVLLLSHEEVLLRAQSGQLHELDSMARKAGDNIDQMFGGKLQSIQLGSSNYQLPYTMRVDMLYYNKDLFDARSIPYPDEYTTFPELVAMAKQLQEGGTASTANGDKIWSYIGKNPLQPAINAGWSWLNEDSKPAFADKRVQKVLELQKELVDSGATPSSLQIRTDKLKSSLLFAEGKLAMMVEDWWPPMFWSILKFNHGSIAQNAPAFRYDVTFLPRYDDKAMPKQQDVPPGWGYAVNARTKHPFEAYLFAKFLATENYDINGYIPANKESDFPFYNQIFNTFIDENNEEHTGLYSEDFLRKLKRVMEETVPVVSSVPPDKESAQLLTSMKDTFNREADRYFAGMITVEQLIGAVQSVQSQAQLPSK
ncbi:ABC transporter substrate-binding protein [Paenibacillus sp. GCM10027626]|uniref:ABC transporter substrate-binding protein n=1 Tax=Paenibacillus sp. GCM10027626 TaxID=3273411 RepID=UPI003633534F